MYMFVRAERLHFKDFIGNAIMIAFWKWGCRFLSRSCTRRGVARGPRLAARKFPQHVINYLVQLISEETFIISGIMATKSAEDNS